MIASARFWKKNGTGYLFIAPWLIGFALLQAWPFLASMGLSLTSYDIISPPRWVGFENYRTLFLDDAQFWQSLGVTLRYGAVAVPLGVLVGVGLALLLNLPIRGQTLFRTLFYLPSIMPQVATAVLFAWILNPELGLANGLLKLVGVTGPAWLQDPKWAPWTLVMIAMWGVGGSMVIYLAGLKDVPVQLHEAALIDGAGAFTRLRTVTLPMLSPVIFFNVVMGVIGSFQAFTEAYVMTRGGPDGATTFYALYLFQRAWTFGDMGYACAMAWVLFVVIALVSLGLFKTQDRWVFYER